MTSALLLAVGLLWSRHVPSDVRPWVWPIVVVPFSMPLAVLVWALVFGFRARQRWVRSRRRTEAMQAELLTLGELTALGLGAGLPVMSALAAAGSELSSGLRAEVDSIVRSAAAHGGVVALAGAQGVGRSLYLRLARAVATGAPVRLAIEGFVTDRRAEVRAAQAEAARRLPVALAFPVALLILPGFVLLTVAPAFITALQRLQS